MLPRPELKFELTCGKVRFNGLATISPNFSSGRDSNEGQSCKMLLSGSAKSNQPLDSLPPVTSTMLPVIKLESCDARKT